MPSRSFEFRSVGEILIFVLAGMGRAIVKAKVHFLSVVNRLRHVGFAWNLNSEGCQWASLEAQDCANAGWSSHGC